jgi:hypothetical protein
MQANADGTLKKGAGKLEKANVKDNLGKKEAGKVKPKGIKIMPDKGVTGTQKTIKESIDEAKSKKWEFTGSKGDIYVVQKIDNMLKCSCPGFTFRGECKHVKSVEEQA